MNLKRSATAWQLLTRIESVIFRADLSLFMLMVATVIVKHQSLKSIQIFILNQRNKCIIYTFTGNMGMLHVIEACRLFDEETKRVHRVVQLQVPFVVFGDFETIFFILKYHRTISFSIGRSDIH